MSFDPFSRLLSLLGIEAAQLWRAAVQLVAIWVVGWLADRLFRMIARRIVAAVDDHDDTVLSAREKRGHTIAQLVRSVGRAATLIVCSLLSLNIFIDIRPLLAGVGILSLAISFGAQSLVKDFIAGFFVIFENQFVVGDVIEVAGKSGEVERMTLRIVQLRDVHGVLHTIPNGQIAAVSNFTRGWGRAVVEIEVAFGTNVDHALALFREEATKMAADPVWQPKFDGNPEVVGVERITQTGLTIRTLLRSLPGQQWSLAREFRRRMKNRLDREGIQIPLTVPFHSTAPAAGSTGG
jgi:small conductance mechanosensitive channel